MSSLFLSVVNNSSLFFFCVCRRRPVKLPVHQHQLIFFGSTAVFGGSTRSPLGTATAKFGARVPSSSFARTPATAPATATVVARLGHVVRTDGESTGSAASTAAAVTAAAAIAGAATVRGRRGQDFQSRHAAGRSVPDLLLQ